MELLQRIETRRSSRAFKPTPVPKEIIEKILKIASKSPSFQNTQPWEVAVVSGKKKEELSKILYSLADSGATSSADVPLPLNWPPELEKRIREHTAKRFKAIGVEREDDQQRKAMRLRNFEFYGAPCALFLFMDRTLTPWSIFDMGLFAQSILLTAHSFGLGSCVQAMLAIYPDAVREFLDIPESKQIIIGISLGYPDLGARINSYQSERVSPDNFAKWYV